MPSVSAAAAFAPAHTGESVTATGAGHASVEQHHAVPTTTTTTAPQDVVFAQHLRELNEQGYTIIPSVFSSPQITELRRASTAAASLARGSSWPFLRTLPKQFPPWSKTYDPAVGIWGVQHLLHPSMPCAARQAFARCYFGDEILNLVRGFLCMSYRDHHRSSANSDGATLTAATATASTTTAAEAEANAEVGRSVKSEDKYQTETKSNPNADADVMVEPEDEEDEDMIMELFNILITPDHDFSLRWHRDDVSFAQAIDAEADALNLAPGATSASSSTPSPQWVKKTTNAPLSHVQYNVPLYYDSSLHVVPGSHLRPRTTEEQRMLDADPYTDAVPGLLEVQIQPGDVVFYDNNIIHRGVYSAQQPRATLHGSVGDRRRQGGRGRARNVLQHGVGDWIADSSFSGLLGNARLEVRADKMRRNLMRVGKDIQGDVGYSHDD